MYTVPELLTFCSLGDFTVGSLVCGTQCVIRCMSVHTEILNYQNLYFKVLFSVWAVLGECCVSELHSLPISLFSVTN